jgi:hypothetical protein
MSGIHPLDLQGRAELAIDGLTGLVDPERDGLMYFLANWRAKPPRADHGLWDCGDGSGRHVDALTLARTMVRAGSPAANQGPVDGQIEAWMMRFLGEDGLSWLPAEPWAAPWGEKLLLAEGPASEQYAELSWAQRGTLMGLTSRFLRTSDEAYLSAACRMVDALQSIARSDEDGLYFPEGYYRSDGWRAHGVGLAAGIAEVNAVTIGPLVRLYEAGGYGPALSLAEDLARFALRHTPGYRADGSLDGSRELLSHYHTRSCFILGILKLGLALGRREYVAWARQTYRCAQEWGTEFGFCPEALGTPHAEVCCTTDMIEIALLLGQHVDRGYYADAERYGRNHLLESQFLSGPTLLEGLHRLPPDDSAAPRAGRYSTFDNVAERQLGGFASRPTLRDAFNVEASSLMQCCNAAGTRGLYDLWRYAIEEEKGGDGRPLLSIHLRFSLESPSVRVVSYEPAEGRIAVTAREDCRIALRLPDGERDGWVAFAPPRQPAALSSPNGDGYVQFRVGAGERAEVHYRLAERTACYEVGVAPRTDRCVGHWRGETLMSVEPEGEFLPLYAGRYDLPPVEPALPAQTPIPSL